MKLPNFIQATCLGAMVSMLAVLGDKLFAWHMPITFTALCLLLPSIIVIVVLVTAIKDEFQ